jgi:hypothetical protein
MSSTRFASLTSFLASGLALLTGACAPAAVTVVSYGADGVSLAETGKSTTDHLASIVSKKDCAFWRVLRSENICHEREGDHDPYDVEYNQPNRQPSEDGVSYAPPLRASASAPAASWTAESYEDGPTGAPSAAPVAVIPAAATEVAPPPPAAAASTRAVAPDPAKVRKSKARPHARRLRKASQGPVASVP